MTYTIDPAPGHERDAVDALLSGLLDIQDDIAQAVVWLAENWSADLPAPYWYGRGHQHQSDEALRLAVYCTLVELARVAALMDVTTVDDQIPDSSGHRHRRARRSFGSARVVLEAYYEIDDAGVPVR